MEAERQEHASHGSPAPWRARAIAVRWLRAIVARPLHAIAAWPLRMVVACALGAGLAAGLAPLPAMAQARFIPPEAKRGMVKHVESMIISIDGKPMTIAPGGSIRDANNLVIVPTALPATGALADYQIDANGQVRRVWLLTPDEAAKPRPKPAR